MSMRGEEVGTGVGGWQPPYVCASASVFSWGGVSIQWGRSKRQDQKGGLGAGGGREGETGGRSRTKEV